MAYDDLDLDSGDGLPDFLRDPLGIPKRHWRWMLLAAILGLGATGYIVAQWRPLYEAHASLLVASQQIPKEFVRTTVPEDPFSRLNAMVSQVLSRQKLITLIEEFDLFAAARKHTPLEELVATMRNSIAIRSQGGRSSNNQAATARVYTISYQSSDPQSAAQVANRLATLFLEAGIQSRMERANEISRFLKTELDRADEELRAQNLHIANFNEKYRGELPGELNSNVSKLERLQSQRQSLEIQIMDTEARIASMPPGSMDPSSPEGRLAALRQDHDQKISIYTPEHPSVVTLRRQMAQLEEEIARINAQGASSDGASRSALLTNAQHNLASLRAQLANVMAEIKNLDARVARTPKRAEELMGLSEKARVAQETYMDFLRKVNAAELAQTLEAAQQGAEISIMDRAFPPRQPLSTRTRLIVMGLTGTLAAIVGAGVAFEFLDPVLVAPDQAERLTGVPELGSVSHIG